VARKGKSDNVAAGRWQKGFSSRIGLDRLVAKHFADVQVWGEARKDVSSRISQMTSALDT